MRYTLYSSLNAVIAADFNQDGLLDLAASDYVLNSVDIRLGEHNGQFGATKSHPTGSYPMGLASADFNGDGKLDLLTINSTQQGTVSVLLGDGNGAFSANKDSGPSDLINRVVVGDLNRDGILDLVTDSTAFYGVQVLIGAGDGTFKRRVAYPTSYYVSSFALADLNGDSYADVVAATPDNGSLLVMLGDPLDGGALGEPKSYPVGGDYPISLSVGDVDRDNNLDVVVVSTYPSAVSIMLGDGQGGLTASFAYTTTGSTVVQLADLNKDDKLDLLVLGTGELGVRLGLGTGAFGKEALYPFTPGALSPIVGDLDEDGIPDVASLDGSLGTVVVLSGKGDGTLDDTVEYPSANCPNSLTLVDVSRDGAADLVTTNSGAPLNVYFGPIQSLQQPSGSYEPTATTLAYGDLDRDGLLDLVTHQDYYGVIRVLFGEAGGQFGQPLQIETGITHGSIVVVDIDNDGWLDIVGASNYPYSIGVNQNVGGRKFANYRKLVDSDYVYDFAVGDVDGDQLPDLVMSTGTYVRVAHAISPGVYGNPVVATQSTFTEWVELADLDRDGRLDLITASDWSVRVHIGSGDGGFPTYQEYPTQNVTSLAVDDANGDGYTDIITIGNMVGLLLGNGDGKLADEVLSAYAQPSTAMALGDINGDGWPDVAFSYAYSYWYPSQCNVNVLYGKCR